MPERNCLITGASTGIGRAAALRLDRSGLRVFAGVRRPADGDALRADASERMTPVMLDVTDPASIESTLKVVADAVGDGGLGGLVNNAGIGISGAIEFLDLDELRRQLEVNVVGLVAVTQRFLPLIRRARGRVVNIGSMGGYNAAPFLGPYAASKFAVEALTDSLRRELRPWQIEVSIVEPGSIDTEIWGKAWAYADDVRAGLSEEGHALYDASVDRMIDYAKKGATRAIPADAVARAIEHALTARRPRTRYRVGLDAKLVRILTRVLPDRWMDALLMRMIGLS